MVDLRLADSQVETCIVDTGYTGTFALNWKIFYALQTVGALVEQQPRTFVSIHGMKTNRHDHVSTVAVGDFQHHHLSVDAVEGSSRNWIGPSTEISRNI